jgi:hypothetical protein
LHVVKRDRVLSLINSHPQPGPSHDFPRIYEATEAHSLAFVLFRADALHQRAKPIDAQLLALEESARLGLR